MSHVRSFRIEKWEFDKDTFSLHRVDCPIIRDVIRYSLPTIAPECELDNLESPEVAQQDDRADLEELLERRGGFSASLGDELSIS